MNRQRKKLFLFVFLFLAITFSVYASEIEASKQEAVVVETEEENSAGMFKGFTKTFKANKGYLDLGLRFGYIYGRNSYDYAHHTSELEFPFRSYVGGGKVNLGYADFSINSEFWGSLFTDPSAGWHTKDKDWESGELTSDTKSYSDMNATIWDANLRYNFLKYSFSRNKNAEDKAKNDNLKIGILLGYRYERFGYKDFGLYQTGTGAGTYGDGQEVSEYKVKYRMPYCGLALDLQNDKFGILMNAKYSFSPNAKDYDHHTLRDLHFYGEYKKQSSVFMGNLSMFWRFLKDWEASAGVDAALIRIDGITWEENHDPSWDADQNIDTKQFIYWLGVGYRF